MATARGIGKVIYAVALEYERSLEDILQFRIGYQSLVGEELVGGNGEGITLMPSACILSDIGCQGVDIKVAAFQFSYTTTEAVEYSPCGEVQVLASVFILEEHRVEGDDIMDVAVRHHHRVLLAKDVLPRTEWRVALTYIDITWFAVVIAVLAVGLLHHIRSPHHLCCGPVHHEVSPVDEVLAHPHLCWSVAIARTVGGGIQVISIAELPDCRVGEISWNKRV